MKEDDLLDPMHDDDDALDPVQSAAASWFARLRADDASADDRRDAEAWLAADPSHRAAYARLQHLWNTLGDFAASAEVDDRLSAPRLAGVVKAPAATTVPARVPSVPARPHHWRWLAASAAALTVAIIGWQLLRPAPPVEQQFATTVGQQRSITLEDGTVVELDAASRIAVRYSAGERRIALQQGRAFFSVASDAARPLSVDTSSGSVRVTGTRFEVHRHDAAMAVALYEGKVQLRQAGDDSVVLGNLAPGQRAQLSKGNAPVLGKFEPTDTPAWTRGQLVFEDLPLADAIEEFNRYGGTPIHIADPALQTLRVSGVFRSNDAAAFIEALRSAYAVSSDEQGGQVQLHR